MTGPEPAGQRMSFDHRQALKNARSKVLQRLFAGEYVPRSPEDSTVLDLLRREGGDEEANAFGDRLFAGIQARLPEIDAVMLNLSQGWSIDRMARIDRNILRIGLWEILYEPGIPFRVSVHEALELAHLFSEPEAVAFINGILHEAAVRNVPEKGPYGHPPAKISGQGSIGKALTDIARHRT